MPDSLIGGDSFTFLRIAFRRVIPSLVLLFNSSILIDDLFFNSMLGDYNVAFLGRENFKLMRHGGYANDGSYIHTRTVEATKKDTHTETGYIGFNMELEGTNDFIQRNFDY